MKTVRYRIERLFVNDLRPGGEKSWVDESLVGAKTLAQAKDDVRRLRNQQGKWQKYRIVRVTTTREVVR